MTFLLNNWKTTLHSQIYGQGAFYDLYHIDTYGVAERTRAIEHRQAISMRPGDTCCVLGRTKDSIVLDIYELDHVELSVLNNDKMWVMRGNLIGNFFLTKLQAMDHPIAGKFFNKAGHVVQWSVKALPT